MAYTTINKGSSYFNIVLYTGTGATRSITGAGFQPDWVWIKERSASASDHNLSDAVRGAGKALFSNTNGAEYDYGTGTGGNLRSFDSDGFSLGTASQTNANGTTFVSWNWLGANTTVSNTAGTLTSTVSANPTAGFSIVSYTATSGASSIGHGLGVAPNMIILKARGQTADWVTGLSVNGWDKYLLLNSAQANTTDDRMFSPSAGTDPTSTLFWSDQAAIGSAGTMIAYCFAAIKGYSKFGSYTGNGSTDGTFVYTGFMPKFIMIKRTDSADNPWAIYDTVRDTNNPNTFLLRANTSNAEADDSGYSDHDHLSNGFKLRQTWSGINASGGTYIYMAFAENPFVSSTGIPTTAR